MPTPAQMAWSDAEIGVIITYDINIYAPQTFKYNDVATLPGLEVFNPKKLDTDQWLESAVALGAKYAVLVAKHGTGFCLWPSKANPYHVGNTPWRNGQGDIVADFIRSCKKYGIKPGMYYHTNASTYYGAQYTKLTPEKQSQYNQIVKQQLTELWTNYGPYFEIWFDGGVMEDEKGGIASDVNELIRTYQSDAVLFQGPSGAKNLIRWIGNEQGKAPYPNWSTINATTASDGTKEIKNLGGSPDGKIWCPAEADFSNRKHGAWLWYADGAIHPVEEIVNRYYTTVGMNANMLVGMVIDTAGLFPEEDRQQFILAGKEINRRFGNAIAETSGKGKTVSLKIGKEPVKINHVVIQENIAKGERVRKYTVEANVQGQWLTLCTGTSIGHKRIQVFEPVTTNEIRFRADEFAETPNIKRLAVYDIY
jgi:alpha-L-fucosidase